MLTLLACGPLADTLRAEEDKLAAAEKMYQSGDWEGARKAYAAILESGGHENLPPAFFYNLGTATLRAGAPGAGYAYLLRALAGRPWDSDFLHNLNFAETKLSPGARAIRPSTWSSSWPVAAHFFPPLLWLLPSLIGGAGMLWSFGSGEHRWRSFAWVGAFVICLGLGVAGYEESRYYVAAVVKTAQVSSGPGSSFSNITSLEPGAVVNYEDARDGWMKIRFTGLNGQEAVGWVEHAALLRLRWP